MSIFYLISIITLGIIFLLLKKTEKRVNLIFWVFLTLVLMLCYNVFECYLLSLFKIKSYLTTLAIINFAIVIIGLIELRTKRKIQEYYFKWQDIVAVISILIIVILISYQRYGCDINIKYESSDPATHYIAAKQFYKNKTLLANTEVEDRIYEFKTCMPAAYVNTGILFYIGSSIISESDFYYLYILFDIFVWYLGSVLFYLIVTKNTKKTFLNIIGLIFTVLYMLAYPLNSMLFGFAYLSLCLIVIEGIIAIAPMLRKNEVKLKYILPMGFLLTFTTFFSYYLFVPIVYASLGIYLLINMVKNRKKIKMLSMNNILSIIVLLLVPIILGFCYFIFPKLALGEMTEIQAINIEGYIYRNLYSNFILIGPLVLYYIIDKIKNKTNDFINNSIIISILFILIMLMGVIIEKVSTYYYFKTYFLFWIFAMMASFKAIEKLYKNKDAKKFVYAYLIVLIGIHLYSIGNIDIKLQNKNMYINLDPSTKMITHIYSTNEGYIKNTAEIYTLNQKEILKYCENNIFSQKDSIAVCATNLQQRWIYAIYGVADVNETREFALIEKKFDIESWLKSDKRYYLYLNNGENVELNSDENRYKVLYNNIGGIVLERIDE